MPYKPNYTDIRSTKMRDPSFVRTIDFQWDSISEKFQYIINNQQSTRPPSIILVDGVLIKNNSSNNSLFIGIRPLGASAPTEQRFRILPNKQLFLPVNDLADVVYQTQFTLGAETFSVIAS